MTLPMLLLKKFNLNDFNKFLNVNNLQLIISTHKIVQSEIDLSNYDQVHLLPPDPLLDINNILPEINLLITDYSSIATDFLLLDRPLLYVMPDYDQFLYERGLLEDMRDDLPGYEANDYEELKNYILHSIKIHSYLNNNATSI